MKKTEKIRVNYLMPVYLHDFVKEEANKLGIPASTMYIMIVNAYKDNLRIIDGLSHIEKGGKKTAEIQE